MPLDPPLELLVHAGDGKTGTSAIQRMLRTHPEALAEARTRYLGLMLENAFEKRHAWQDPARIQAFHDLPHTQAVSELKDALTATVERAREAGLARLIWSNESLINRSASTIAALTQLGDGVRIRVVMYVRRHDAWARSAFIQWSLKHKTYEGPLRDFSTWRAKRGFQLMPRLSPWRAALGAGLTVRNFDAIDDAARDFCEVAGLDPAQFATERLNQTPSGVELALRAAFHEAVPERALPARFERAFQADAIDFDRDMQFWLIDQLPSAEALTGIADACAADRAEVNALLAADGQRGLDDAPLAGEPLRVDQAKLVAALCQVVARQALRLERLEQLVSARPSDPAVEARTHLDGPAPAGVREALAPGSGYFGAKRSDCLQLPLSGNLVGLRLELQHGPEFLNLRGIECLADGQVVSPEALGAQASQSSIARDDPKFGPGNLLRMAGIHTAADEHPWWEVRFTGAQRLDALRIYNRGDGCCRRARAMRVSALRPGGGEDCLYDGVGEETLRIALRAACQAAGVALPVEWPADAAAAGHLRADLVARIATRIEGGLLAPESVDWRAVTPLLPLWGASQPADPDWTLVAAMLLTQHRSRQGIGLATLSWLLDRRSRLQRLESEINRLAVRSGIGPFMLTRHGLRHAGMLRADPGRYERHLSEVVAILESLGREPMAAYGTLLGAVREGAFLAHDDDVDVLYLATGSSRDEVVATDLPRVAAAMQARGFEVEMLLPNNLNMHVKDPRSGAVVDAFPCWQQGGRMQLHMEGMQVRGLDVELFLPRSTVMLGDASLPAPARAEEFLEARYGAGWRIADPYFEWPWKLEEGAAS